MSSDQSKLQQGSAFAHISCALGPHHWAVQLAAAPLPGEGKERGEVVNARAHVRGLWVSHKKKGGKELCMALYRAWVAVAHACFLYIAYFVP